MYIQKSLLRISIIALFSGCATHAMVYDNRYFPEFQRNPVMINRELSAFSAELFYTGGNEAWDTKNKEIGIPELYGLFDLATLINGMVAIGLPNPLPSEWQGANTTLPFAVGGTIESEGLSFAWHQSIARQWALGASWVFMGAQSRQEFQFLSYGNDSGRVTSLILGEGDKILIDVIRREAFAEIGIVENYATQGFFGDIDAYVQWGDQWEYALKCRSLKAAGRVGVLFPTGAKHNPNIPASVPFGGDGHWGLYISGHAAFEIKEDIFFGTLLRVSKRFKNTRMRRVSVAGEPSIFGALVIPASVDPGVTVVFSPYAVMENVREGFALGIAYTLTKHEGDTWCTACNNAGVLSHFKEAKELSQWGSSYITLSAQYDFGKIKVERTCEPILSFRWDWPADLFVTRQVVKTNKVSIGLDFVF
jgi:hypothetical protein